MAKYIRISLIIIFILFTIVGLIVTSMPQKKFNTRAKASENGVSVSLIASSTNIKLNSKLIIYTIFQTNGLAVSAADLNIAYDPNYFDIESFTLGQPNFFAIDTIPQSPHLIKEGIWLNGKANIIVGTGPTNLGKNGKGTVAVLTLLPKQIGTTKIAIDPATYITAIGKGTTNVKGTVTDVDITILNTDNNNEPRRRIDK